MAIWKNETSLEKITQRGANTLINHLDIKITEVGDDYLRASMPVDQRTHQPMGILHGGASAALAETVGSVAANLAAPPGSTCVGLELNANHLKSVRSGLVYATATPEHIGRTTQVWSIRIVDEAQEPICVSRLTMAVLQKTGS